MSLVNREEIMRNSLEDKDLSGKDSETDEGTDLKGLDGIN